MSSDWQLDALRACMDTELVGGWWAWRSTEQVYLFRGKPPANHHHPWYAVLCYGRDGEFADLASALAAARRFAASAMAEELAKMAKHASGLRWDNVSVAAQKYLDAVACPPVPVAPAPAKTPIDVLVRRRRDELAAACAPDLLAKLDACKALLQVISKALKGDDDE